MVTNVTGIEDSTTEEDDTFPHSQALTSHREALQVLPLRLLDPATSMARRRATTGVPTLPRASTSLLATSTGQTDVRIAYVR